MIYTRGQYLEVGRQYTASFVNGLGAILAGPLDQLEISKLELAIPWIKNSVWVETGAYGDWTFTCAMPIDAQGLGTTLEAVLQSDDPLSQWSLSAVTDVGEGHAANAKKSGCSLDNLGACFSDAKSVLIWGVVGILAIVFLTSGGPSLVRSITGK